MKISELIKRLQEIKNYHGDCECGCLCETDDIFDDDIEYYFTFVEDVRFHKKFKISSGCKEKEIDLVDFHFKVFE